MIQCSTIVEHWTSGSTSRISVVEAGLLAQPFFGAVEVRGRRAPGRPPPGIDLAYAPSDCDCVLQPRPYSRSRVNRHSRSTRLLHRQAWLRMFGDGAGSAGLRYCGARPAGDSLPLRPAAHSQPGQIHGRIAPGFRVCTYKPRANDTTSSWKMPTYVMPSTPPEAQYSLGNLATCLGHRREFVVKDCAGRLLAFGANL